MVIFHNIEYVRLTTFITIEIFTFNVLKNMGDYSSTRFYLTIFKIHGVNFDIRVHTPGKLASAHPIPQLQLKIKMYTTIQSMIIH